jgi:hypothetical protein
MYETGVAASQRDLQLQRELDAASQRIGERRTCEGFLPGFTQDRLIGVGARVERAAYRLETRVARFADHAQENEGIV